MKNPLDRRTSWAAAGVLAAGLVALGTVELARGKSDPRTFDVRQKAFGRSMKDWTVEWWQWVESIPASVNPLFDETGDRVEVGQRGPVWFLCGVYNLSGVATRAATIPSGKALLFPIINYFGSNTVIDSPQLDEPALRGQTSDYMAAVDPATLHVTLDSTELAHLERARVATRAFDVNFPEGNVFQATGVPIPRSHAAPCLSDGYWVMLKPLSVGPHVIRIQGAVSAPYAFTLDVTYQLDVVDSDKP